MIKILQWISNFEFTATGGIAIYFLMCTAFVTMMGIIGIITDLIKFFK